MSDNQQRLVSISNIIKSNIRRVEYAIRIEASDVMTLYHRKNMTSAPLDPSILDRKYSLGLYDYIGDNP